MQSDEGASLRHRSMEAGLSGHRGGSSMSSMPPDFTPGFIKSSPSGSRRPQRIGGSGGSAMKMKPGLLLL